jgi:lysophospholipase L1-like esterase
MAGWRLGFGGGRAGGRGTGSVPAPLPAYASIVTFGDSITVGTNSSNNATKSWAGLVATGVGATLLNQGISGTVLQNGNDSGGAPRVNNGRDRFASALLGANKKAAVFIAYGFNDARYTAAPATFNVARYTTNYREILNGLILGGYARDDIYVGSPYYITDAGLTTGSTGFTGQSRATYETFVAAAAQVAAEFGVRYCDLYAALNTAAFTANVNANDNIHPTDSGHAMIAAAWQTQTIRPNAQPAPATVGITATGQDVTVTASAVPGATSYDYALVANPAEVAANGTGLFASMAAGTYQGRARAVFADGSKGPWSFSAGSATVASGGTTVLGQTESYATTADNTLLTATTPTAGSWAQASYATGTAAIAGSAIRGSTTVSQLAVYHLASSPYGNGQFAEAVLLHRGTFSATSLSAGVVLRSDPTTQNYLTAFYNGGNIRLFKCIGGTLTQLGTTYTLAMTSGTSRTLRVEAAPAGSNCALTVLLDGTAIISVTEPEANLSALGTQMGVRLQTSASAAYSNTTGPVLTSVKIGRIN